MPKFFIENTQVIDDEVFITGEDFLHLTKSLRIKIGEKIVTTDSVSDYDCEVSSIDADRIICKILEKKPSKGEPNVKVYVYISLTKGDKLELVCQKVTELGAYAIIPFVSSRCVSKPDNKSATKKRDRLQKIVLEASKQSGRSKVPEVFEFSTVKEVANDAKNHDLNILFYENEQNLDIKTVLRENKFNSVAIVVGPEGGFSGEEISIFSQNGFKIVTLGDRILRAETAPIAAISAIMYETNNFGGVL